MGNYKVAEPLYLRCLEARQRLLGAEHPDTLSTFGNLGLLYSDKGDYEQAEANYKRDLEASERLLGPEHPSTLTIVGNLGGLYRAKGYYEQAEVCYQRRVSAWQTYPLIRSGTRNPFLCVDRNSTWLPNGVVAIH